MSCSPDCAHVESVIFVFTQRETWLFQLIPETLTKNHCIKTPKPIRIGKKG